MNHFDNLPLDLQDHILKMKEQLEDRERREQERKADLRRKLEVLNAMEEYLIDNGLWDNFVEGFMDGLEGAEREEYVEHFGLEG